ncbi:hypothetical protein Nmel_009815 [Mimus melanotis]
MSLKMMKKMLICKAIIILPVLSFTHFYMCWKNGLILNNLLEFLGKKKNLAEFTVKRATGLLVTYRKNSLHLILYI